jgi:hypothetical protein
MTTTNIDDPAADVLLLETQIGTQSHAARILAAALAKVEDDIQEIEDADSEGREIERVARRRLRLAVETRLLDIDLRAIEHLLKDGLE